MSTNLNPEIYVACLASYNAGILFGKWIQNLQSEDDIHTEIQQMLVESPVPNAEEWAIHDYTNFGSYPLSEHASISSVCEVAAFIEEHGDLGIELAAHIGGDLDNARDVIENNYHGVHNSELDFATDLFDECYSAEIPENLRYYIDYDAFRRDLFMGDYYSIEINGDTHIFSSY